MHSDPTQNVERNTVWGGSDLDLPPNRLSWAVSPRTCSELDLHVPSADARKLDVVVDGLPLFGLAIDTTLVSVLHCDGIAILAQGHFGSRFLFKAALLSRVRLLHLVCVVPVRVEVPSGWVQILRGPRLPSAQWPRAVQGGSAASASAWQSRARFKGIDQKPAPAQSGV